MIYRTVQGDMWDGIAFKIYGDARFLTLLLNANPAHAAVSVFSGNIVLNVPELPTDISSSLPPGEGSEAHGTYAGRTQSGTGAAL